MQKDTRIKKGQRLSPRTEFQPGQHWRERKPYWDRAWLVDQYIEKLQSASEIAAQFGVGETTIYFWLKKHEIPTRSISQTRKIKKWGAEGEKNPMFGKYGEDNPNWKGGLTPARQKVYASSEWRKLARLVRKRDKVCRLCGSGYQTEIHHIDPFSVAPLFVLDIGNVILLCRICHRSMRGKESRWKRKLYRLLA